MTTIPVPVYDTHGTKVREIEIEATKLDKAVRKALLKEAYIAYMASQRQGTHATKTRAEVAGGGHKPWRQKGTGRARQGTTRAPQWAGGGKAHGPKPRDYSWRLTGKANEIARRSSIRFRLEQGALSAVEGLDDQTGAKPQTKLVSGFLKAVGLEGKGALIVSELHQPNLYLSARNIQKVEVVERRNLCAGKILQRANLVFTVGALEGLLKELPV